MEPALQLALQFTSNPSQRFALKLADAILRRGKSKCVEASPDRTFFPALHDRESSSLGSSSSQPLLPSNPSLRAFFKPRALRLALRVPLFSFGEFVTMEILRPLSPLADLVNEIAMLYLYSEECAGPAGRTGQVTDPRLHSKVMELFHAAEGEIEEAGTPFLPDLLRARMHSTASRPKRHNRFPTLPTLSKNANVSEPGTDKVRKSWFLGRSSSVWLSGEAGGGGGGAAGRGGKGGRSRRGSHTDSNHRLLRRLKHGNKMTFEEEQGGGEGGGDHHEEVEEDTLEEMGSDASNCWTTLREEFHQSVMIALSHLVVIYFSTQWDDSDALVRANQMSWSRLRPEENGTDKMQVRPSKGKALWHRLRILYFNKKATQILHAQRRFKALASLLKIAKDGVNEQTIRSSKDLDDIQRPRIVFLGGMGAGKSSLLKEVLGWDLWKQRGREVVIIEADRIKLSDPLFQALTKRGPGASQSLSAHVHEFSTSVANAQLLAALLHGRDIIMDGTMTWREYAAQTLAMVRKIHQFTYRIGSGYHKEADGTVVEKYWDIDSPRLQADCFAPYYIQVVGCSCPPHLAVARGLRRALLSGRGVPVKPQLRSHKLFATNFPCYLFMADEVRLYDTAAVADKPVLIALQSTTHPLVVDPLRYEAFLQCQDLNENARDAASLFNGPPSQITLSPLSPLKGASPRFHTLIGWDGELVPRLASSSSLNNSDVSEPIQRRPMSLCRVSSSLLSSSSDDGSGSLTVCLGADEEAELKEALTKVFAVLQEEVSCLLTN